MQDQQFSIKSYIYRDRVRAHACKHSERGGRDKSITDVTARRSHRLEQEKEDGVGEEVQRPTYRTVNAYCLENTDDWCVGSTLSLSRYRCARWWPSLNYHSVW